MYKCKYFKAKELVSRDVYLRFGDQSYQFFDEDVLADLDTIRETWGSEIIINNWYAKGSYNESGLRSNVDSLVRLKKGIYLSAHCLACGFDLKPKNGKYELLHTHIANLIKTKKLKKFRRLESFKKTPTWVHVDAFQTPNNQLVIFS